MHYNAITPQEANDWSGLVYVNGSKHGLGAWVCFIENVSLLKAKAVMVWGLT